MKNHLNILPKLASFDLKCSKMRWRLGLRPRPRWGSLRRSPDPLIVRGNAPSALGTLYFVSIFTSQFPFRAPPYGIPGSATEFGHTIFLTVLCTPFCPAITSYLEALCKFSDTYDTIRRRWRKRRWSRSRSRRSKRRRTNEEELLISISLNDWNDSHFYAKVKESTYIFV